MVADVTKNLGSLRVNVEHGPDTSEVMNVHDAGPREVGDEVREKEMWIKKKVVLRLRIGESVVKLRVA